MFRHVLFACAGIAALVFAGACGAQADSPAPAAGVDSSERSNPGPTAPAAGLTDPDDAVSSADSGTAVEADGSAEATPTAAGTADQQPTAESPGDGDGDSDGDGGGISAEEAAEVGVLQANRDILVVQSPVAERTDGDCRAATYEIVNLGSGPDEVSFDTGRADVTVTPRQLALVAGGTAPVDVVWCGAVDASWVVEVRFVDNGQRIGVIEHRP